MVRHGRTKKRRAGRIGKVKLKNRSWNRYDPKPKVDEILRDQWDPSKSATVNLALLGLQGQPKGFKDDDPNKKDKNSKNKQEIIPLFDVPESDDVSRMIAPTSREIFPLSIEEEEYIVKCMSKHGTNYIKMFRDIKINNMQHTEEKLRKLGSRYLLLQPEQRRMEIPEKVKPLVVQQVLPSSCSD